MSVRIADSYLSRIGPVPTLGVWVLAILLFGIGDTATTLYILSSGAGVEGHPIAATVLETVGIWILVPWKAAAVGLFYGLYRIAPDEMAIGVPIGLTVLGAFLTFWNTYGVYLGHNPLPIF